jgi:hypothetical protein
LRIGRVPVDVERVPDVEVLARSLSISRTTGRMELVDDANRPPKQVSVPACGRSHRHDAAARCAVHAHGNAKSSRGDRDAVVPELHRETERRAPRG